MAYKRQNFENFETVLTAQHLDNIQNGILDIQNDLYDEKEKSTWDFVGQTTTISKPSYTNEYSISTFSGWCGCIGKPSGFNKIRFPVKPRIDYPITSITVKILEVPALSTITLGTSSSQPYTPRPSNWSVVAAKTINFDEDNALTIDIYNLVECEFDEVITNSNGKYYYLSIMCDNLVTMGFFKTTYNDIEFNPWIWYGTNGSSNPTTGLSGTYNSTSKEVYTLACEFYCKASSTSYLTVGTSKKDKFFNLVNECLNNSESFGEIFQESYKNNYICGSKNLIQDSSTTIVSQTSTFTGVVFPIGVLPEDMESTGVLLKIAARSYNSSTTPVTMVHAFLYSVEDVPLTSKYKGEQFSSLSPQLLRSGIGTCDIAVGKSDTVLISWSEGPFVNKDNKFLMLGYECNTYNNRCLVGRTGAAVCGSIDGNSYDSLETWYSTSKTGEQSWRPRWQDTNANAWSMVTSTKYYDLGEKFYTLLDQALDNKLGDVSLDVKIVPTSEVRLAKQYDLVVGDTFQLYYSGVVKAFDINNEGITIRCPKGKEYPRYWEYTPASGDEGTYTLKLYTRQLDGTIISEGSTKIVVHSKLTNDTTPSNLTCLVFGDSLTSSGAWAAEGLRRIYGTDSSITPTPDGVTNTVTTYGSKNNIHNGFRIYHEGYGGWTWNSFLTAERGSDSKTNGIVVTLASVHGYDLNTVQKSIWTDNNGKLWELEDFPSENQIKFNRGNGNNETQANTSTPISLTCDTLSLTISPASVVWESANPFYNEATESLDFVAHATEHGASVPDIVACLLTWNAGGGTLDFNQEAKISANMEKASQLLRIIHEDCPNAKIIVMGIQISSLTGGTGYNYGANGTYADRLSTAFYAFDYDKALEELVTDSEFGEYCYYVDTKGQFDTIYNMPFINVNVNPRNSKVQEMRGTNGVHPSTEGYYQIGDAFYRALTKVIPLII